MEEAILAGVPVNVTLLFSPEQNAPAAEALIKGLERRVAERRPPDVRSIASVFIRLWDRAIAEKAPNSLPDRLGVAMGMLVCKAHRDVLDPDRRQ